MSKDKDEKKNAVEVTVTMKIGERLRLLPILPAKGPIGTARIVRKLHERLTLTEDEVKEHQVKQQAGAGGGPGGMLTWKTKDEVGKEFTFVGFEVQLILNSLSGVNERKEMTPDLVPLWDMFFPEDPDGTS